MEFQLSDGDLAAVASYLRAQPATSHAVPEHRLTRFGKALMAFAIAPARPATMPPVKSPTGATIERGEYLANNVSSCVACHTNRGPDGTLVGPRFGGGQRMDVAADPTKVFVTPNLTPDPATSPVGAWSEDTFVARFRAGEVVPGTPMPWGAFARFTDDDVRAIRIPGNTSQRARPICSSALTPSRPLIVRIDDPEVDNRSRSVADRFVRADAVEQRAETRAQRLVEKLTGTAWVGPRERGHAFPS